MNRETWDNLFELMDNDRGFAGVVWSTLMIILIAISTAIYLLAKWILLLMEVSTSLYKGTLYAVIIICTVASIYILYKLYDYVKWRI